MPGPPTTPVAIIGAGPYGLSVAAHLRRHRVAFRIFGQPMRSWIEQMPSGMFLKSVGFASNLSSPDQDHTLAAYCAQHGLEYAHDGWPVPLETFTGYGTWFQRTLVPEVEGEDVVTLERAGAGFRIRLGSGEALVARRVVVAVGQGYFPHVPGVLAALPGQLVSHSSQHRSLAGFAGRDVTVIGAGQSALESAALLHEHGADVRVLARGPRIVWNTEPVTPDRSLWARLANPQSGLGSGWKSAFYSSGAPVFYRLPLATRAMIVARALGPAGAWWLKARVIGQLPVETGQVVQAAEPRGDLVRLTVAAGDGTTRALETEHVLAATGYRVDLSAIPFLGDELLAAVRSAPPASRGRPSPSSPARSAGGPPVLSPSFESSVSGLYFIGLAAAQSFGPVQRFVFGTAFTARRLGRHLAAVEGGARRVGHPEPARS